MWNNSLRELWNISLRSMWNEICPHSRQRIFHICGANISQRSYFTCLEGKFRWKKPNAIALGFFLGRGGRTRSRRYDAKPSFWFWLCYATLVFRGSDSPPDCHSLPLPFEPSQNCIPAKRKSPRKIVDFIFLAGAGGLEPATHGFGDRYSTSWAIPLCVIFSQQPVLYHIFFQIAIPFWKNLAPKSDFFILTKNAKYDILS